MRRDLREELELEWCFMTKNANHTTENQMDREA